jgi:8-oxo-dGTP diphosphatase
MVISSSAVLILDENQRFLLQKRDQSNKIYFPGLWGLFGGACNRDENPFECAIREINEEINISISEINLFLKLEIEANSLGLFKRIRYFYVGNMNAELVKQINLNEGCDYDFFSIENLPNPCEIVPIDLAAIMFYYQAKKNRFKLYP